LHVICKKIDSKNANAKLYDVCTQPPKDLEYPVLDIIPEITQNRLAPAKIYDNDIGSNCIKRNVTMHPHDQPLQKQAQDTQHQLQDALNIQGSGARLCSHTQPTPWALILKRLREIFVSDHVPPNKIKHQ